MISSQRLRNEINKLLARTGYRVQRVSTGAGTPAGTTPVAPQAPRQPGDVDPAARKIATAVKDRTMTSPDKLFGLIEATRYVSQAQIPGDIVECGVWRGGSMIAVARTLLDLDDTSYHLHLFDTYDGMSEPSADDRRIRDGRDAQTLLDASDKQSGALVWARATLDDVRAGWESVPYPDEKVHFVKGPVEETIPDHAPAQIALLRLDTDWYESTKHELDHLYDRLSAGGVIIFDDYGYWEGARKAVDEFIESRGLRLLLNRLGSGRIAVKTDA